MPPKLPSPAQRLKETNSELYYQVLNWKDTHRTLFNQATGGKESFQDCNEPELLAVVMLTVQQLIKPS